MAPIALPHITISNLQTRTVSITSTLHNVLRKRLESRSASSLFSRANSVILPTTYLGVGTDMPAGTIVAIVLGVTLGTMGLILLVWWALWQQSGGESTPSEVIEVRSRRSRSPPIRRPSRRGPEVVEIRRIERSRSPRPRTRIVEERIVEERIPRGSSRPRSVREEIIVEPRRRDEAVVYYDDESVSTEPPPRRTSYRRSGEREYVRRSVR
jgi:hypothetical protein